MVKAWPGRRGPVKGAGGTRRTGKTRSSEALLRLLRLCRAAEASAVPVISLRVRYKRRLVKAIAAFLGPGRASVKSRPGIAAALSALALRRSGWSCERLALSALRASVKRGLAAKATAPAALALRRSGGSRERLALSALRASVKSWLAIAAAIAALALRRSGGSRESLALSALRASVKSRLPKAAAPAALALRRSRGSRERLALTALRASVEGRFTKAAASAALALRRSDRFAIVPLGGLGLACRGAAIGFICSLLIRAIVRRLFVIVFAHVFLSRLLAGLPL